MSLKTCTKCNQVKTLDDFHIEARSRDGHRPACKECSNQYSKGWRSENREHKREYQKEYQNERSATAPNWRIKELLNSRLQRLIQGKKSEQANEMLTLLDCDFNFLISWFESQFVFPMNWDNYATIWEIDHVIPTSSYNLVDPIHQRLCYNWSNVRPSLVEDNQRKSNALDRILITSQWHKSTKFMVEYYSTLPSDYYLFF